MRQLQKIDYSHFVIPLVKDPTEIHVLSVSSDKCSPVKSRGGMKDYLIRTWLLRCTKGSDCTKCYFFDKGSSCMVFTSEMVGPCSGVKRDDREHVFFEKVGEVCDNSEEDS